MALADNVSARPLDRIDTGPRFSEADAIRLNRMFRASDTSELLNAVLKDRLAGDVALVSSFGAESAVLLHLAAQVDPNVPVLFLDTEKHFPETIAYRDELVERIGLTNLQVLKPDPVDIATKDDNGLRWSWDPDGCCDLRKVRPLAKVLSLYDASLTGRKAFQSSGRATLPRFEVDASDAHGRLKINPLIDWSVADIAAYFEQHDLPAHPLVAQGYPSIGCSPCTRPVKPGEDPRAGRWSGWEKTECDIHTPGTPDADDLPPDFEPVF